MTPTKVLGHESALRTISGAIDDVARGATRIVAVAGEAGIGKSMLLGELAARANATGIPVLATRCLDLAWTPVLIPWKDLVGQGLQAGLWDPTLVAVQRWLAILHPLLAETSLNPDEIADVVTFSPNEARYRIFDAFVRAISALTDAGPLVIVIDDAHWADDESIKLLHQLLATIQRAPLLVAIGWRDDGKATEGRFDTGLGRLSQLPHFTLVSVLGLDTQHTAALIASVTGQTPPARLVTQVREATSGNPFYIQELARHLHQVGQLEGERLSIPASLRQVVNLRLQALSPATQRLLRLASVCTGGFSFALLQGLTALSDTELLDAIDEAIATGLIEDVSQADDRYDFSHALVRTILYEAWSSSRRERLHRSLAEWLVRQGAGSLMAGEIARHYHISRSIAGADAGLPYAFDAATQARRSGLLAEEATWLRIAGDLAADRPAAERAAIHANRALAEALALHLDEANASAMVALKLYEEAGEPLAGRARFLAQIATALHDGGQAPVLWQPLLQQGLAWVDAEDRETWARLTLLVERFEPFSVGPIAGARWLGTNPEAIAIARASSSEDLFARSLQPWDLWDWDRTQHLADLVATWKEPAAIIRALTVLGADWLYHHGAFRRAQAHFEQLHAVSDQQFSVPGKAEALVRLAIVHAALGDERTARACERDASTLVAQLGEGHRLRASIWWARVLIQDAFGEIDPAAATFFTSYIADPFVVQRTIAFDDAALSTYILARTGQAEQSLVLLESLVEVLRQVEPTLWLYSGAVSLAAATVWTLGLNDFAPSLRQLADRAIAAGHGDFPCSSNVLNLARMAALEGDAEAATRFFAQARRELDLSGQRPLRSIVDFDEGTWLARENRHQVDRARHLLEAAKQGFERLNMGVWAANAEQHLARLAASTSRIPHNPFGLTSREVEVAVLIADGHSDREIADLLYLSIRTVNTHVRNLLVKTGFRNRLDIAAWVLSQGQDRAAR